ncbi:uncharacterized protein V1513DRAFT_480452 [Lipomyces chichibuensis]|uniref:uncharacterized protein n=1 Tax=Lipomyces chichibuensis TaxID=1546026 RepID=UPI003343CC74
MVGVAGGSRGCTNCKKRKVKCDETFPKCLRCIKSNRDCGGPIVGPVFRKQRVGAHCKAVVSSVPRNDSTSIDLDPASHRLRNLLMTDDEARINAYEKELRSGALPSVLFELSIQRLLRAFNSTSIPRELLLFPEYDLYNYCITIFLDKFSIVGHPHRFGEFRHVSTWLEMLPQFVLSPLPSSTTFASRALVIAHCSSAYQDSDIALVGSNWYVHALRYQKELVSIITSNRQQHFRANHSSDAGFNNIVAIEEDSTSPSTSDSSATSSLYQDLIQWARTDTPTSPRPSKDTVLLPENSSLPLDLPGLTTGQHVSNMRGNMMSHEDDSITAGTLLSVYEVVNGSLDSSWITLLSGVQELMRMRGPEAYRTGFNSALFQSIRGMMAIHGMVTRKNSFLNSTEWKTIPWEYMTSEKLIHHHLLDLILEVPEYQEVIDRLIMYSFTNDKVDPDDDDLPHNTKRTPRLRKRYRTREVWAELRETHKKLIDLEARFDKWFEQYSEGAREYARENIHLPPTVTFDPVTVAPNIPQLRCSASTSDSEYMATHFFRPFVKYATLRDALVITIYLATRMMVAYLLGLTVCFAYVDFEDSLAPTQWNCQPVKGHPEVGAYFESKTSYMRDLARIICRSTNYIIVRASNIAVINLLFPLRLAHSVIQDTLERGWIWNQLRRMHDVGIRLSLADLNGANEYQNVSEWKKFKSLDVCPGCGEHVRPLMQCLTVDEDDMITTIAV